MANRPVHEIRLGQVKAAIWRNETDSGFRYSVALVRIFRTDNGWEGPASGPWTCWRRAPMLRSGPSEHSVACPRPNASGEPQLRTTVLSPVPPPVSVFPAVGIYWPAGCRRPRRIRAYPAGAHPNFWPQPPPRTQLQRQPQLLVAAPGPAATAAKDKKKDDQKISTSVPPPAPLMQTQGPQIFSASELCSFAHIGLYEITLNIVFAV